MICVLVGLETELAVNDNHCSSSSKEESIRAAAIELWNRIQQPSSSSQPQQQQEQTTDDDHDNYTEDDFLEWREYSIVEDENGKLIVLVTAVTCDESLVTRRMEQEVAAAAAAAADTDTAVGVLVSSYEVWATSPAPLPLRPLDGYESYLRAIGKEELSADTIRDWGIGIQSNVLDDTAIFEFRTVVDQAIHTVESMLACHRPHIQIGMDSFLFQEIASRSTQRFDLRLTSATEAIELVRRHIWNNPCVRNLVYEILGEQQDDQVNFDVSVVYSRPGATTQGWHADGDHYGTDAGWELQLQKQSLAPPYAVCLFLPLIDLTQEVGYTQFWPKSHKYRGLVGFGPVAELTQATYNGICPAGDAVWYDYRLLHRGMPNNSVNNNTTMRPILQVIFKRNWYKEQANYGTESIVLPTTVPETTTRDKV